MKQNYLKRSKKTMLIIALATMVGATSLVGCSSKKDGNDSGMFKAGKYTAKVTGMHEMTVTVTLSNSEITNIAIDHQETPGVGEPVAESLPKEIIEIQGLGVDTVSGATLTSNAVINGVIDALKQAGISDADLNTLMEKKAETVKEADQELTADVVVIGAGGAGMAAAVTACLLYTSRCV